MHKRFSIFFTLFFLCCSIPCFAQSVQLKKAFENENYPVAIAGLMEELRKDPEDHRVNLLLGRCYLESHIDYSKSIFYLEKIKGHKENDFEALYYLGRAYHLNYKFDLAISSYQTLIDSTADSAAVLIAKRQIEMCENAKKLVAQPVDVTIKNLGDTINSNAPDYNAYIDEAESMLVFSSKRKKKNKAEGAALDGYYTSDIFLSYYQDGAWQKLKSQSNVCTPSIEEVVGLSADGKLMFLNVTGRGVTGDMVISKRKTGSFKTPVKVENTINTGSSEMTASVSQDKQILYYGSNREGGVGQFDIYTVHRLPDLSWGWSTSLDMSINSKYNELYPQLSPDEKTLYFASEGHNSMGGYDLFKSDWDEKTSRWGAPQNLGYPINTPDDDLHFAVNADGSVGYISSFRKDSRGDLDIYSVKFNGVSSKRSIVTGKINTTLLIDYSGAPNNINKSKTTTSFVAQQVSIDVYDNKGGLVGHYLTNPSTGTYVLILPPGKYSVKIYSEGFKQTVSTLEIYGRGAFVPSVNKDFQLESKHPTPSIGYKDISQ